MLAPLPPGSLQIFSQEEPPPPEGTSLPETAPPTSLEPQTSPPLVESAPDADGDGLPDNQEEGAGTNPYNPDTDYDGVTDTDEIVITETDPTVTDSDSDGVSDYNEFYGIPGCRTAMGTAFLMEPRFTWARLRPMQATRRSYHLAIPKKPCQIIPPPCRRPVFHQEERIPILLARPQLQLKSRQTGMKSSGWPPTPIS
jgi:hypothetical protein